MTVCAEPPIPMELLSAEAQSIAARYRVSAAEALRALAEAFAARPELAGRIRSRWREEDVTRWREYRRVVTECRKRIYYALRRYYGSPEKADLLVGELEREAHGPARPERIEQLSRQLLALHTSTRERLPHYAEFYDRFFELAGAPTTLLDVGCGMHPLSYPFAGAGAATERYVAVDADARAVRALSAFAGAAAPGRLVPVRAGLDDPDWADKLPWPGPFELALMLKVVPVLSRLDRAAARRLHGVPAEAILLSGSVESMTRRQNVERRERAVLRRFIEQAGRRVAGEFRAGNEFGYLVR